MLIEILRVLIVPLLILSGALLSYFSHIDRESFGAGLIILGAWQVFQAFRLTLKRYEKGLVVNASTGKKIIIKILAGLVFLALGFIFCFNFSSKIF